MTWMYVRLARGVINSPKVYGYYGEKDDEDNPALSSLHMDILMDVYQHYRRELKSRKIEWVLPQMKNLMQRAARESGNGFLCLKFQEDCRDDWLMCGHRPLKRSNV